MNADLRRGPWGRVRPRARLSAWAAAVALVAGWTAVLPAPVAAQASLSLDPTSGVRGAEVDAIGSGFPADSEISLLWDGQLLKSASAGAAQTFVIGFRVPRGAIVGPHTVTMCVTSSATGGCTPDRDDATFTVIQSATPEPSASQPQATPTASPDAGRTSSPRPTGRPSLPAASFPPDADAPTPEPPPVAAVTPNPTPPNDAGAPEGAWPDLWIKAIEVTQGIQDLENRMPLVAGRRTYARVYIGVIGEQSWPETYGALEARRDGEQIGWLWPENGPIDAQLGAGSRVQIDDSLNFRLPEAWLEGAVTLTAFVYSYNVDTVFAREPAWQNNVASVEVAFHPAQPLTVHLAPLHLHRSFHPDDVERTYDPDLDAEILPPTGAATLRIVRGLYRYHPLALVNLDLVSTPITPLDHGEGHEFDLGDCRTTLVDAGGNFIILADWEPLMEDPAAVDPAHIGGEPDRPVVALLDRVFTITVFGLTDEGYASAFGSWGGSGPEPLPGTPAFVDGCRPQPSAAGEANQTLALYRAFYDWDDEEDLFVGMVHPSLPTSFGGLSTQGTDAVWLRMTDTFGATSPWDHTGAEILAHEAGHAAGLKHVPCRDDDADGVPDELGGGAVDASHPDALTFPACTLADVDPDGYYGFDVYWSMWDLPGPTVISNNPDQAAPNRAWPLMAYRDPGWPDPYHYCRLLDFYGVPCDPTDLGIPWSEPNAAAGGPLTATPAAVELPPGVGLIGLRGSLDPAAGSGSLHGAFHLGSPTASAMRRFSGQYVVMDATHAADLVVRDAAGAELYRVPIADQDSSHDEDGVVEFELLAPAPAEAASFQIVSAGRDVAGLDVSPSAPTVSWAPVIQEPDAFGRVKVKLAWSAADEDRDRLTYTLLYAPDGEHWQVLAAGLERRSHEVQLDTLPGGDAPVFKVIAFDGARAAEAVSTPIPPVPGQVPRVVIIVTDGNPYPTGTPITLGASAFDLEDRTLPPESIAWTSSIDGELGTGSELSVDDLSAGSHTITATVTDSDGLVGRQSFALAVDAAVVQPAPDPAVTADMATIFAAVAAGQDPGAAIADAPTTSAGLLPFLVTGLVLAIGGAALVVVRRQRNAAAARRAAEPGAWRRRRVS